MSIKSKKVLITTIICFVVAIVVSCCAWFLQPKLNTNDTLGATTNEKLATLPVQSKLEQDQAKDSVNTTTNQGAEINNVYNNMGSYDNNAKAESGTNQQSNENVDKPVYIYSGPDSDDTTNYSTTYFKTNNQVNDAADVYYNVDGNTLHISPTQKTTDYKLNK